MTSMRGTIDTICDIDSTLYYEEKHCLDKIYTEKGDFVKFLKKKCKYKYIKRAGYDVKRWYVYDKNTGKFILIPEDYLKSLYIRWYKAMREAEIRMEREKSHMEFMRSIGLVEHTNQGSSMLWEALGRALGFIIVIFILLLITMIF